LAGISAFDADAQGRCVWTLPQFPVLPNLTYLTIDDATAPDPTVRLAADGDQAASAHLVTEHHASMVRVAYAITGDAEAAAGAVQIAWSIAWRRLGSLRETGVGREPWVNRSGEGHEGDMGDTGKTDVTPPDTNSGKSQQPG